VGMGLGGKILFVLCYMLRIVFHSC